MIHFTDRFYKILNKIEDSSNNPVSTFLKSLLNKEIGGDILLDFDFSPSQNIDMYVEKDIMSQSKYCGLRGYNLLAIKDLLNKDNFNTSFKARNLRVSPLLSKLESYTKTSNKFSSVDIEDFINLVISNKRSDIKLEVVSGDDIKKWYSSKTYYRTYSPLHGSCMAKAPEEYFEIYAKNKNCKMVILTKDDKLVSRAILWELDKPVYDRKFYMDRIYYYDDSFRCQMLNYAKENNYLTFDSTSRASDQAHIDTTELRVTLENYKFKLYPYMDTFRRLDNGKLYDNSNIQRKHGIKLTSTNGCSEKLKPSISNRIRRLFMLEDK